MTFEKNDLEDLPKQAKDRAFENSEIVEARNAVKNLKSGKSKALHRLAELDRRKRNFDITSEGAISELTEIETEARAARRVLKTIEEKLSAQEELLKQAELAGGIDP